MKRQELLSRLGRDYVNIPNAVNPLNDETPTRLATRKAFLAL